MRVIWYDSKIYLYNPTTKTKTAILDNFVGYPRQYLYNLFQRMKNTPKRKRLEYIIPYWFFVA